MADLAAAGSQTFISLCPRCRTWWSLTVGAGSQVANLEDDVQDPCLTRKSFQNSKWTFTNHSKSLTCPHRFVCYPNMQTERICICGGLPFHMAFQFPTTNRATQPTLAALFVNGLSDEISDLVVGRKEGGKPQAWVNLWLQLSIFKGPWSKTENKNLPSY